ncbi:MAG: hypothetical protein KAS32_07675 [Candidatus Peribacteraceae bacterium]|nr:hypothetical protein [Candidatus Peribacteraceae bacterium]
MKTANIAISVVLLKPMIFMAGKTAYKDDKRPSADRSGCTGARKCGEIC